MQTDAEIKATIKSFPTWHYQFNLNGNLTPIRDPSSVNRHNQRKRYFFDPLIRLLGGSLKGKRVLDLGCNAGFWSLLAIRSDCDFVLGIDARQMHIDQADFVFEVESIDEARYRFLQSNIFDIDYREVGKGHFDIVFCLGLLYHIAKPMTLFEKISEVNSDILIIDTSLSPASGSMLELRHETPNDPRHTADYELVMVPTKQAVIDMVQPFGYSTAILEPQFQNFEGCTDYQQGLRSAFIGTKQTDLSPIIDSLAVGKG